MTANEILKIKNVGDIFSNDINIIKSEYRDYAKKYHPDTCEGNQEVFIKIKELYEKALKLIEVGDWEKTNFIKITRESSKVYEINYNYEQSFELGKMFCTKTKIIYLLDNDKEKYYKNYLSAIKNIKYKDTKMKEIFEKLLPDVYDSFKCTNGKYCIILNKTEDVVPLQEVNDYFGNKIDDKHIAWIMSRLSNISCLLYNNGLVHNGINMSNCFVSPEYHSVLLLGGWWYCNKEQDKMIGTTKDIFSIMPISSKENKLSNSITDLESIKLLGRTLFNEINCRKLNNRSDIPKQIKEFLTNGSSKNAYKEFEKWDVCLDKAYGVRRFIKMNYKK